MASDQEQFEFGGFVLHAGRRQLQRDGGTSVALTPRLYNALYLFVSRPGELIDKRELMASLWKGLVVEDNNLSQLILALRRALDDHDGRLIRTEPRRGFRLAAEVRALHRMPSAVPRSASEGQRTTLAVLPFAPLTATDRGALLAIGMADTLIARLSTLPQLVVRSLGAVRRFAEGGRDAVLAGRELEVDWVVDGTLQHDGAHLRASARLLSVAEGTAAWSDRFDAAWTSVFDVQDQIAERVAQALGRHLAHAPSATRNVDAYQLYLGGLDHAQGLIGNGLHKASSCMNMPCRSIRVTRWRMSALRRPAGVWSSVPIVCQSMCTRSGARIRRGRSSLPRRCPTPMRSSAGCAIGATTTGWEPNVHTAMRCRSIPASRTRASVWVDSVKQRGRSNDNHLGRLDGDECRLFSGS